MIEKSTTFDLKILERSIRQGQQLPNAALEGIHFLNHLIRESPSKRFETRNKVYFCSAPRVEWAIDKVFEIRHGFVQSIRWGGLDGLTVNLDTTTAICWDPTLNIAALVQRILQIASPTKITSPLSDNQWAKLKKLRKLSFWVKYGNKSNAKTHIIDGFVKHSARTKLFGYTDRKKGIASQISVEEYVHKCYNLRLKFPNLPLIQSKKCFFPMEVCFLCPVRVILVQLTEQAQRYLETLDSKTNGLLIQLATHDPRMRRRTIEANVANVAWNSDQVLREFGIEVTNAPVKSYARVLPPPTLTFNKEVCTPSGGKWKLDGIKFHEASLGK